MTANELNEKWLQLWPRVVARSWMDDGFKQTLVDSPHDTLEQLGLPIPPGFKVMVVPGDDSATVTVDGTGPVMVLRLPDKPDDLDEGRPLEQVEKSVGKTESGQTFFCFC